MTMRRSFSLDSADEGITELAFGRVTFAEPKLGGCIRIKLHTELSK